MWTAAAGARRYGTGKWKKIVDDDALGPRLAGRDNTAVGHKWRTLEEAKEPAEEPAAKKAKSDDPRSVISDHQCVALGTAPRARVCLRGFTHLGFSRRGWS